MKYLTSCSIVSIVNFEQVNAGWVVIAMLEIWFKLHHFNAEV